MLAAQTRKAHLKLFLATLSKNSQCTGRVSYFKTSTLKHVGGCTNYLILQNWQHVLFVLELLRSVFGLHSDFLKIFAQACFCTMPSSFCNAFQTLMKHQKVFWKATLVQRNWAVEAPVDLPKISFFGKAVRCVAGWGEISIEEHEKLLFLSLVFFEKSQHSLENVKFDRPYEEKVNFWKSFLTPECHLKSSLPVTSNASKKYENNAHRVSHILRENYDHDMLLFSDKFSMHWREHFQVTPQKNRWQLWSY